MFNVDNRERTAILVLMNTATNKSFVLGATVSVIRECNETHEKVVEIVTTIDNVANGEVRTADGRQWDMEGNLLARSYYRFRGHAVVTLVAD